MNFQDSVDAAVQQILGEQDRIDVLIHNAGNVRYASMKEITYEDFEAVLGQGVKGLKIG